MRSLIFTIKFYILFSLAWVALWVMAKIQLLGEWIEQHHEFEKWHNKNGRR